MSYVYLPNQNLSGNILMFDLQTWHIPNRVDGVKPCPVMDVTVQKLKNPTQQLAQVKKKRKVSGVTSTVFKAFEEPLSSLDLPEILGPIFQGLNPKPGFLRVLLDDDKDVPLTESKYGLVPKGSVLSYQQSLPSKKTAAATNLGLSVPDFQHPVFTYPPTVLSEKQQLHYDSLTVTMEQALEYKEKTREQSASRDWHRLPKASSNSLKLQANLLQKKGSGNAFSQASEQQTCANSSHEVWHRARGRSSSTICSTVW